MNREQWLTELAKGIEPIFKGFRLAKYRLTCGWPCKQALSRRNRRIGECHGSQSSKDGTHEIFISPSIDDQLEVAGTVAHEMVHVVAGIEAQHKGKFLSVARHIGLTKGKPTSAMPGERLNDQIKKILEPLGAYPHSALVPVGKTKTSNPSSVRLECECGCRVTISRKMLEEYGPPTCACGGEMTDA